MAEVAERSGDRSGLSHVLVDEPANGTPQSTRTQSPPPASIDGDGPASPVPDGDEDGSQDPNQTHYSALTQTTRRNANGSVSSVFSGNKIRHLKKEDGVPLWRKDIQYEFLTAVFADEKKVFTRLSDNSYGHSFADTYIDTLSHSSKTSKILKEKLVQDQASAVTMAMVCLLVNIGRMNTTLNFFPEMRAQLRTYHSIPALQAQRDPHAYKQLQDAPRLKSILKGASEDEPQPGTIEEIMAAERPRTNAVNLIFVLAQYAPKVSETHFTPPRDFFDLVMRSTLSSKSRAQAFLWLMWWYLESDFSAEDALKNPFGAGEHGEGADGLPLKVPGLEVLTEEQAALENVDTEEEKAFGEAKRKERVAIVNSEPSPAMTALKRARKTPSHDVDSPLPHGSSQHRYGSEGGSPSPPASILSGTFMRSTLTPSGPLLGSAGTPSRSTPSGKPKGPGRGNWRRNKFAPTTSHAEQAAARPPKIPVISGPRDSIIPPNVVSEIMGRAGQLGGEPVGTPPVQSKKSRPLTTHQLAINEYRQSRILKILERGLQSGQVDARKKRLREGGIVRAWKRIRSMPSGWDSEEEVAHAGSENNKDEETKHEEGEYKLFGKRFHPASTRRKPTGVYMAGYVMPGFKDVEDAGEQADHMTRLMGTTLMKMKVLDELDAEGDDFKIKRHALVRRKSDVELYAEALEKETWDVGDRPRLVRKSMGTGSRGGRGRGRGSRGGRGRGRGRGRGGRGAAAAAAREKALQKEEAAVEDGMDVDAEESMAMDVDGEQAELDEEDRELLGEVDAEESEEDGGDGEGEDGDGDGEDGDGEDGDGDDDGDGEDLDGDGDGDGDEDGDGDGDEDGDVDVEVEGDGEMDDEDDEGAGDEGEDNTVADEDATMEHA